MLAVSELSPNTFPIEFLNVLPHTCDSCGSHTEITETLTILRCSNPSCGEKSVQRMVAMMKDLGVKDMGESRCRKFLENFDVTNPYIIFAYDLSDGGLYEGCSDDFCEHIFDQIDSRREMLLWEYVKIGNLPGIRDSARKLFAEYDSLEAFYEDIEDGGIDYVRELLKITGKAVESDNYFDDDPTEVVSVKAVEVYNTLIAYKEELLDCVEYVDIKQLDTAVINICISTAVGYPFTSKSDFVRQMNERYGDKIHLNFLGSMSNDIEYLIWSKEGSMTSKVRKANSINEKRRELNVAQGYAEDEGLVQIVTGLEFEDFLSNM